MSSGVPPAVVTGRRATSSSWQIPFLVGVVAFLGALVGVWLLVGVQHSSGGVARLAAEPSPATQPERAPSPPGAAARRPAVLDIPAVAVSTPLVSLGLMPDRTVEVPDDPDVAGWFRRGPSPGGYGSAVILGHVDSSEGPAVFARLQELRPGDRLTVRRADGSTVPFVVLRSVLYANADFPAVRVYAAQGSRRLNLVTCGGVYDPARGGYQSNLVVYTRVAR